MEFKDILKELRLERRLTHEQLAKGIDQSKAIIGFWESGRNQPKVESIIRLALFFEVSADFLLGLERDHGTMSPRLDNQKSPLQKMSDEEMVLLESFKKLTDSSKTKLLGYIQGLCDCQ